MLQVSSFINSPQTSACGEGQDEEGERAGGGEQKASGGRQTVGRPATRQRLAREKAPAFPVASFCSPETSKVFIPRPPLSVTE